MIYNNGFPATYQPYTYQPYQQMSTTQMSGTSQQMMTPPTIRAEIIQVDNEDAANAYPVGVGTSQMMIAKDDSAIYVKTALANGQATLDVFTKRPRTAQKPTFDPDKYVTRDELEKRLEAILEAHRPIAKEADTNGDV